MIEPGSKIGRWTVIDKDDTWKLRRHWRCVCSCGKSRSVSSENLLSGRSKSCGCARGKPRKSGTSRRNLAEIPAGTVFSKFTVLSRHDGDHRHRRYYCRCECGRESSVLAQNLLNGNSKSCGCWRRSIRLRHGKSTKEHDYTHRSYRGMSDRCLNKSSRAYKNYGGRGITICDRWLGEEGFWNFVADMSLRPVGMTLDRIDNDGNYCPENCRWATLSQQAGNKRKRLAIQNFTTDELLAELARRRYKIAV